jgi:YfiH family protein
VLLSSLLAGLPWVDHGFGTRHAPLSQEGMASLKQIHSALPLIAERHGFAGEGDALLTACAGVPVSVRTADCLPILVADPSSRAVAAIHAGWRGTAAQIVVETLRRMRLEFGTDAGEVHVAIGPGIGVCCYEVGAEVARRFGREGAGRVDLAAENRRQLIQAGVPETQIDILNACTRCEPERFHSYRRDGDRAGRMISYIHVATRLPHGGSSKGARY